MTQHGAPWRFLAHLHKLADKTNKTNKTNQPRARRTADKRGRQTFPGEKFS
jgi:hypothetical protein